MSSRHFVFASLILSVAGCDIDGAETAPGAHANHQRVWSYDDSPTLLGDDFEYTFANLPTSGDADQTPWAGNYWPTYHDNINYKWDGANSDSPVRKYELAFGRTGLEDRVSAEYGIDSLVGADCTTAADCDGSMGEVCAKRDGADTGTCSETWFGICHAWAPAAIMEREPQQAVTHNGVEFKVQDIKALVSLAYDAGVSSDFMSLRCNDSLTGDNAIERDEFGNPTQEECADTNAGSFHVAVTNLLGLEGRSFVEDRTQDYEVWNQPVRDYRLLRNTSVSESQAQSLAGGSGSNYTFNDDAVSFRHIEMELRYITESSATTDGNLANAINSYTRDDEYEYILELDANGRIVGGEWVGHSKVSHPDFLWVPTHKASYELAMNDWTPGTGITWEDVQEILELSYVDDGNAGGGGTSGGTNPNNQGYGFGCHTGALAPTPVGMLAVVFGQLVLFRRRRA